MKSYLSVALAMALIGPAGVAAQELETTFSLRVGESVDLEDIDLRMGFSEVVHDSRCPRMVMCIWEGDAEVGLWAESPGFAIEEFNLNTHPDGVQQVEIFGYLVTIVGLDPYPVTPGDIPPDKYVVSLVVEKAARVSAESMSWSTLKTTFKE